MAFKKICDSLNKGVNKDLQTLCALGKGRNSSVKIDNIHLFLRFLNKIKSIKINLWHVGDLGPLLSPILGQYNIKPVEFLAELNKSDKFITFGLEGMVLPLFCKIYIKTGKYDLFVRPYIVFLFTIFSHRIKMMLDEISFFI